MTVALIGLVGVVIGALLSGVISDLLDRRKQRTAALSAARAIVTELRVARAKLGSVTMPVRTPSWWVGTPVLTAWQGQLSLLAARAPAWVVDATANAYAKIESWVGEREEARIAGAKQPTEEQKQEIVKLLGELENAIAGLERFIAAPPGKTGREAVRVGISLASIAVFIAFLTALFLPRADVTTGTVASAVEHLEGRDSFAECGRAGSHWDCAVTQLAGSRSQCGASARVTEAAGLTPVAINSSCSARAPPIRETVEKLGNKLAVHTTTGAAERSSIGSLRLVPEATDNLFVRAWRTIWGE